MIDIFAILDAAINEIGQKRRPQFPLFPSVVKAPAGTGMSKSLENKGVPVLPVVPAGNDATHDETKKQPKMHPAIRVTTARSRPRNIPSKVRKLRVVRELFRVSAAQPVPVMFWRTGTTGTLPTPQ